MNRVNLILIFFTFAMVTLSCKKENMQGTIEPTTHPHPEDLRTQEEELAFMETKANSLTLNEQGYWEADLGSGIVMIYVPQGTFTMGNNDLEASAPAHQVTLSHYWISKTPITKGQFRTFVSANNYVTDAEQPGHPGPFVLQMPKAKVFKPTPGFHWDNAYDHILEVYPEIEINDNHPVSCVSWNDAIAYTNWLQQEHGLMFTLPTEAEWEFAARGTDGRIYPWGNEEPDGTRANYADETMNRYFPNLGQAEVHFGVDDGYVLTSPVGSFPNGASPIGALDMAGNLTEWVYDSDYLYTETAKINPIGTQNNGQRQMKAGFWCGSAGRVGVKPNEIKRGHNIRSDARQGDDQNSSDDHLGFRIVISYVPRN
ncbi:MAG: formylglycine-generating enzyme family protein [Flavobacteriales bacterium]|nr:formylglycine-generating enzyme family protein [Flavobacteriales bacterium]